MFAAALQCPEQGCGHCDSCRRALARDHPDIDQFTPEKLQITAEESLALIHRSALTPMLGRWNVLILEDTDRLNDVSGNALLKSLEEPGPHTVWVLCAPTPEDVLPTIVSRARHLRLRTPTTGQVTEVLVAPRRRRSRTRLVRRPGRAGTHRPGTGAGPRRAGSPASG